MTVTAFKKYKFTIQRPRRNRPERPFFFVFESSNNLFEGLLFLYRNKRANINSALYSFKNLYCLIIYSKYEKPYFLHLKEYCITFPHLSFFSEYIEEYGKPLITHKAVKNLKTIFFKEI